MFFNTVYSVVKLDGRSKLSRPCEDRNSPEGCSRGNLCQYPHVKWDFFLQEMTEEFEKRTFRKDPRLIAATFTSKQVADFDTFMKSMSTPKSLSAPPASSPSTAMTLTEPESPDSFTFFAALPAELRLKIWEYTFDPQGPIVRYYQRAIEVDTYDGIGTKHLVFAGKFITAHPAWRTPYQLRVCSESRRVALSFYKPMFATCTSGPTCYLNLEIDCPFFNTYHSRQLVELIDNLGEEELLHMRQFTARLRDWRLADEGTFRDRLRKFKSLRYLFLVVDIELDHEVYYAQNLWESCKRIMRSLRETEEERDMAKAIEESGGPKRIRWAPPRVILEIMPRGRLDY